MRRALKGLAALVFLGLLAGLPLALIDHFAQAEHARRVKVLNTGHSATAEVTASFDGWSSKSCVFDYTFRFNGKVYEGGEGGCSLVAKHPVGSTVNIRFDPADPGRSVAVGADVWPGWWIVPYLLGAPLLLLAGFVASATLKEGRLLRRSRRGARRQDI